MTRYAFTALPALLLLALLSTGLLAQPVDEADDTVGEPDNATLEHIERLEQMLRDVGVDPPARPTDLAETQHEAPHADVTDEAVVEFEVEAIEPIIPPSFATVVLETETDAINERADKAAPAIKHVRRWLDRDDVKRRVAAQDVIKALTKWAEAEMSAVKSADDPVTAYMLADGAIHVLGQDPLAKPFKRYMMDLQRDRSAFRELEAMAEFRRAQVEAREVGLLGDWALIDFSNVSVRNTIKALTGKLTIITNHWPNTEGAKAAQITLDDWARREAQAIADLPAWRYTVQLAFIQTGTRQESVVITQSDGTTYVEERTRPVYDRSQVRLSGTFQNTSDKTYRYTFLVGVSAGNYPKLPFNQLEKRHLMGFELIQTPMLAPGEVYNWDATVSSGNIRQIERKGVTMIEAFDRRIGR